MECPTCGFRVSQGAASCAVCGEALAFSVHSATLPARAMAGGPGVQVPIEIEPSPEKIDDQCPECGSELEEEARFCSECGSPVARDLPEDGAFSEEDGAVAEEDSAFAEDDGVFAEDDGDEDGVFVFETVDDDEQVANDTASWLDDTVIVPPPAFVAVSEVRSEPVPEPYVVEAAETGPVPITLELDASSPVEPEAPRHEDETVRESAPTRREPARPAEPAAGPEAWIPQAAAVVAVFALFAALATLLFGPSSMPGFSAAELDLKLQMRAVEWMLGGLLVVGIGLLFKR